MIHTVSILVPVYNASQWLRQCLDSIVRQTYQPLQVVLVDDGSTDDSLAICREYADRYSFVEVYHQVNSGVAVARNTLLDKAKGEFVLFVDSDDWIELNMVEILLEKQKQYQCDIVKCEMRKCNSYNVTHPDNNDTESYVLDKDDVIKEFLRHIDIRGSLCDKLIRTECFINERCDERVGYGEDALLVWNLVQKSRRMCVTSYILYNYNRQNDSSISAMSFNKNKLTASKVWSRICSEVEQKYPQYKNIAMARYGVEMTLLLYNAMVTGCDDKLIIKKLQTIVDERLPYMRRCDFVSWQMLLFAYVATNWYNVAKFFVK